MVQRDRFTIIILSILAIVVIAVAIATALNIQGTGISHGLSDDEKNKVVDIALNDSVVRSQLFNVQFKYFGQQGWEINSTDPRVFTIGNISIGEVHEMAPGIDDTRYMPYVELFMGHKELGDINVYIYVDLENNRAAYIGYMNRSGPHANGYFYTPGTDGIVQHTEDTNTTFNINNITIVNTGYTAGQNLTNNEKSSLFNMAKVNKTVADFMENITEKGDSYSLSYDVQQIEDQVNGHYYIAAYPEISVSSIKPDGSNDLQGLLIIADGNKNRVVSVEEYTIFMPPPDPMPPRNL